MASHCCQTHDSSPLIGSLNPAYSFINSPLLRLPRTWTDLLILASLRAFAYVTIFAAGPMYYRPWASLRPSCSKWTLPLHWGLVL